MKTLILFACAIATCALFIRLAPSNITRWHRPVDEVRLSTIGGFKKNLEGVDFNRLNVVILSDRRTKILAGSEVEKHITYITRSRFWGFPDYATVEQVGSKITIVGRQRFGRKDFGVNKERILGWIAGL